MTDIKKVGKEESYVCLKTGEDLYKGKLKSSLPTLRETRDKWPWGRESQELVSPAHDSMGTVCRIRTR